MSSSVGIGARADPTGSTHGWSIEDVLALHKLPQVRTWPTSIRDILTPPSDVPPCLHPTYPHASLSLLPPSEVPSYLPVPLASIRGTLMPPCPSCLHPPSHFHPLYLHTSLSLLPHSVLPYLSSPDTPPSPLFPPFLSSRNASYPCHRNHCPLLSLPLPPCDHPYLLEVPPYMSCEACT